MSIEMVVLMMVLGYGILGSLSIIISDRDYRAGYRDGRRDGYRQARRKYLQETDKDSAA